MKISILSVSFGVLALWSVLTGSLRDPNNPPTGRTGAPGETTCGASGCHSGGAYTGTVEISGIPDTITPGAIYSITLTQTSNAIKGGFEMTILDNSNVKCGTFTTGTGTSVGSGGGRQYIRQSAPKTLSNGAASWTFTWKAPASAAGNAATLYFVSLAANGNNKNSGDNVLQGSKKVVLQSVVATQEAPEAAWVNLYPSPVRDILNVDLKQHFSGQLSVFDLNGKEVMQQSLRQSNRFEISSLEKGMYLAQVSVGGKVVKRKFVIW